jgi:hypothetical protein
MLKLYCIYFHKHRLLRETRPPSINEGGFSFKKFWKNFRKIRVVSE